MWIDIRNQELKRKPYNKGELEGKGRETGSP